MDLRRLLTRIIHLFQPPETAGRYDSIGQGPGPWSDGSYQPGGEPGLAAQEQAYPGEVGDYPGFPWPTLTARELEVAWYLQQGMSNEAIANQLGISIATVKTHVHNLLVKFNVRSRWVLLEVLRNAPFDPWDNP